MKRLAALLVLGSVSASYALAYGASESIRIIAAVALVLIVAASIVIGWLWIQASLPVVDEDSGAEYDAGIRCVCRSCGGTISGPEDSHSLTFGDCTKCATLPEHGPQPERCRHGSTCETSHDCNRITIRMRECNISI